MYYKTARISKAKLATARQLIKEIMNIAIHISGYELSQAKGKTAS